MLAGKQRLDEVLAKLSVAELLYVGYEVRRGNSVALAREISDWLLRHGATPGRLNLRGAVFRDLGFFDFSVEAYEDSIELCDRAKDNPYAFVGLGATLRRLGRQDEAYDLVKRARKFYPEDRYVVETLDAIHRDFHTRRHRGMVPAA